MSSCQIIKMLMLAALMIICSTLTSAVRVPISVRAGKGKKCGRKNVDIFHELKLLLDVSSKESDMLPVRSSLSIFRRGIYVFLTGSFPHRAADSSRDINEIT